MTDTIVHICCHSAGLDELSRRSQGDIAEVLLVLSKTGRFSVFEATDNPVIANTMTALMNGGLNRKALLVKTGGAFPWTEVELTDEAKEIVAKVAHEKANGLRRTRAGRPRKKEADPTP
jgi:hypothetical protein